MVRGWGGGAGAGFLFRVWRVPWTPPNHNFLLSLSLSLSLSLDIIYAYIYIYIYMYRHRWYVLPRKRILLGFGFLLSRIVWVLRFGFRVLGLGLGILGV